MGGVGKGDKSDFKGLILVIRRIELLFSEMENVWGLGDGN